MTTTLRRIRFAVAAALLLGAFAARAQTLTVGVAPAAAPLLSGVTHGRPSSFSLNVTNSKAGTKLRQIEFRLPNGYTAQGGAGPEGWTVTRIKSSGAWSVLFRVTDCSLNGIAATSTGTFRLDVTPPGGAVSADATDALSRISPADPCGGATGWSTTSPGSVLIPRRTLLVTASGSAADGPTPMTATVTWGVTNLTTAARTVTVSQAATPAAGVSLSCTPATLDLAAGAAGSFTCTESITAGGSYAFQAGASAAGSTAVGATYGPVRSGGVTASFAFGDVNAGPGDQVQATLTLRNNTGAPVATVTPPAYAALVLQNLDVPSGSKDPGPSSLATGEARSFIYTFDVSGVVGATYLAKATASTTAGATNEAVTPAGTVAASTVSWAPAGVVKARTAAPYQFTVTVVNNSSAAVSEIDVINKQPTVWTGMTTVSSTPLNKIQTSGSDTIKYSGTLAAKATATIKVQFAAVPSVAQTTAYPFEVKIVPSGGGKYTMTYDDDLSVVVPIPDVAGLTILSNVGGQVLAWANTGRTDAPHDGVVVLRTAAPAVPIVPQDFVDYSDPANQTPANGVFYADRDGSTTASLADPAIGTYYYRVCNHDALFVYSACNVGFWNNAGYLDSAIAPVGGWTHQLGGAAYLTPGVVPGNRIAVASNLPDVTILDADTGLRTFDPLPLAALPAASTPAATMSDGRNMMFGADNGGSVLALDLGAGTAAWRQAKAGETFVAGIAGIVRQYAAAGYQAAWPGDTILLASSAATGHLLGVDHATGNTLWTLTAGAPLYAAATYDPTTNRIFVATFGKGVLAWDVGATPGAAPVPAAGWTNPIPGGQLKLPCILGTGAADLACVDTSGTVRVLDTATGAVRSSYATGVAAPNALRRISGAAPGYLVSSTTQVQRLALAGSPLALAPAGTWTAPAGVTLAPAQAFPNPGIIAVAGSDKKLRKLDLATVTDTGVAVDVPGPAATILPSPPVFDSTNSQFVFGTDKGRVWAIPSSSL